MYYYLEHISTLKHNLLSNPEGAGQEFFCQTRFVGPEQLTEEFFKATLENVQLKKDQKDSK